MLTGCNILAIRWLPVNSEPPLRVLGSLPSTWTPLGRNPKPSRTSMVA